MDDELLPPTTPRQHLAWAHLLRTLFPSLAPHYAAMKLQRAGITPEGLRPYRAFLRALFSEALLTYLGGEDGVRYSGTDRSNHFDWCLEKAALATNTDKYRYQENEELVDYLREYIFINLYGKSQRPALDEIDRLLHPEQANSRSDLNSFLDLWNIFERTPRRGRHLGQRVRIPR